MRMTVEYSPLVPLIGVEFYPELPRNIQVEPLRLVKIAAALHQAAMCAALEPDKAFEHSVEV